MLAFQGKIVFNATMELRFWKRIQGIAEQPAIETEAPDMSHDAKVKRFVESLPPGVLYEEPLYVGPWPRGFESDEEVEMFSQALGEVPRSALGNKLQPQPSQE